MLIQEAAGLNRSVVDPSDYGIGAASTFVTLFAFAGCLLAGTGCVIAMMRGRLEAVFGLLGLFALATLITWSRDDVPIGIWLRGLAWALPIGAGMLALARKQDVPVERRLRTAGAIVCTLAVLVVGGGLAVRDIARRVDAQQRAREQLAGDPVLAPFLSSPSNPTVSTSPSTPPEARFSISNRRDGSVRAHQAS
jgi:hypothetical protein